ncbi:M20/M25/M40 family metallo-hydrolase [Halovenus sp. WSH3]|uniref:M20/M25/M40 family metallo-hydrolase n=1 Tax=Halovenus carboxidivorans TaxID=2692199 RepID=A0A6B0T0A5_9EURY|nr:M20/M25/M40 family metallo-hydrolase [Halovenus carboxidivorans]MXR51414.1 M20/M25/M40 family metallo-hydrolase [Halovenus carboxidivorans]
MESTQREFLDALLETASPSGFESAAQRVWIDYVEEYADDVRTDEYGNAVAVLEGGDQSVALTGHGDEIGFMVRDITDSGYVQLTPIGGSDKTVTRGQHVRIHTADGPVPGVIGQTAIHLRDRDSEETADISEQHVDIGAADAEEAEELVERGDPITFEQRVSELANGRIAGRGLDNRVGIWAAAEGFRRAAESDPEATVYAVSTVQEELGLRGAQMVGFDLDPDAVVATDVTHATDEPGAPGKESSGVELGGGPSVARGSANHPNVVEAVREVAAEADIEIQLEATGTRTGTDADAFYTARGGTPSLNVGIPNRYMHTPTEMLELADLDATAELLGQFAARAEAYRFSVDF